MLLVKINTMLHVCLFVSIVRKNLQKINGVNYLFLWNTESNSDFNGTSSLRSLDLVKGIDVYACVCFVVYRLSKSNAHTFIHGNLEHSHIFADVQVNIRESTFKLHKIANLCQLYIKYVQCSWPGILMLHTYEALFTNSFVSLRKATVHKQKTLIMLDLFRLSIVFILWH